MFGVVAIAVAATRVRLEVQLEAVVGSWTTCVSARAFPSAPCRRDAASSSDSSLALAMAMLCCL